MRAGKLRERVAIVALAPTTDAIWGPGEAPQDVATVWASVVERGGSESVKDQGVASVRTFDIEIRYRSDVTSANRLTWRDLTLEIVSAVPDEKRRQLVIEAKVTS